MKTKNNEHENRCSIYEDFNDFVFTQPSSFTVKNKTYEIETWVELIDTLCLVLKKKNRKTFEAFLVDEKQRRTRVAYLAKDVQDIHFSKYLQKSDLYLNKKIDAPRSIKLVRKLLEKFKIEDHQFYLSVVEV